MSENPNKDSKESKSNDPWAQLEGAKRVRLTRNAGGHLVNETFTGKKAAEFGMANNLKPTDFAVAE